MAYRRGCGFFIAIIFGYFSLAFAGQEDKTFDLEPIIVTKSRIYLSRPYTLKYTDLKNLSFYSPIEALGRMPLDLQSRSLKNGIQTDFSLRGSSFQGVLMLLDGQRINDPQTGHHNSDIPITKEDIERIDVIPGIGSSVFGPDAIGGAINFLLRKPQEKKVVLELGGGEHKSLFSLFSVSDKLENLGLRFSLEEQESSGFRYDTDFKKITTNLYSSLDIPDGDISLDFGYQEKEFGAYDFYTPGLGYPSKEWTKSYLLNIGFNLDKQEFIIKPNFLWRRHYDKFALDKTLLRSRYLNHHRTDVYTPNIYFQRDLGIIGRVGLGIEWSEEKINSTSLGKHGRQHRSIFTDASRDLVDRLSLGLSFRADDFDGFDRICTCSGNVRYIFSTADSLSLGVSRSIRIPSFTELYYNDPTTLGNNDLAVEESMNYQIGYDYKREDLSFGTTFFFRSEKKFIDWVKHTTTEAKWQAKNISEAEIYGLENYLKIKFNRYFSLDSNYTYIDKRIDGKGYIYKYGPNYIRHLFNSLLNLDLPFGVQTIGLTYKKRPQRDGWFLLNIHLSHKFSKKSQVFIEITNLLNVEYQEIEGIPQPGRWIETGIRIEW